MLSNRASSKLIHHFPCFFLPLYHLHPKHYTQLSFRVTEGMGDMLVYFFGGRGCVGGYICHFIKTMNYMWNIKGVLICFIFPENINIKHKSWFVDVIYKYLVTSKVECFVSRHFGGCFWLAVLFKTPAAPLPIKSEGIVLTKTEQRRR